MSGRWHGVGGGWIVSSRWRVLGEVIGLLVVCCEWQVVGGCDW